MLARALFLAVALAAWLGALPSSAAAAPPPGTGHLAVRGQDIVDPDGRPIVLRGWNWGHWGKAIEQDAADNAAQGANVVRLPVRWWGLYGGDDIESRDDNARATGGMDPAHLAILDANVRWASRAHLWIVLFLDSNCGQNGTQNAGMIQYCDPRHQYPNGHNFWTDREARARFIDLWRFIAARYKDTPYIGLYEPLPEPGPPAGSAADITQFYGEVMAAIRQVAPGIPFLVGGDKYRPNQLAPAYNPAWKDVVYTGNLFGHEGDVDGDMRGLRKHFQLLLEFRARNNVPVFVQQLGIRGNEDPGQAHLRTLLGLLNDNRIGYAVWEYRGSRKQNDYGVLTGQGRDWQTNQPMLSVISQAFKAR